MGSNRPIARTTFSASTTASPINISSSTVGMFWSGRRRARSPRVRVLVTSMDAQNATTNELVKILAVVHVIKGRHDCR